ncbi:hypothetical protein K439DRAFT_1023121 [Ramaria rubella]|nr:hypothetical protein K439DRAFT_1023121 [Ramaria rubella]
MFLGCRFTVGFVFTFFTSTVGGRGRSPAGEKLLICSGLNAPIGPMNTINYRLIFNSKGTSRKSNDYLPQEIEVGTHPLVMIIDISGSRLRPGTHILHFSQHSKV